MLYIWGVLRGKKTGCPRQIPAVSASENLLPASLGLNTQQTLNSNTLPDSKVVASGEMVEVCEMKASSWEQKPPNSQTSIQQEGKVDSSQVSFLLLLVFADIRKER